MNEINFIKTPLPQEPSVSPSNKIDVTEKSQESFEKVISPYLSPFEVFKKGQSKQASSQALNSDKEDSQVKKNIYDRLEEARKNDKKLPPAIYAIEMKDYELRREREYRIVSPSATTSWRAVRRTRDSIGSSALMKNSLQEGKKEEEGYPQ
mgnify:CR=1 FL=1